MVLYVCDLFVYFLADTVLVLFVCGYLYACFACVVWCVYSCLLTLHGCWFWWIWICLLIDCLFVCCLMLFPVDCWCWLLVCLLDIFCLWCGFVAVWFAELLYFGSLVLRLVGFWFCLLCRVTVVGCGYLTVLAWFYFNCLCISLYCLGCCLRCV